MFDIFPIKLRIDPAFSNWVSFIGKMSHKLFQKLKELSGHFFHLSSKNEIFFRKKEVSIFCLHVIADYFPIICCLSFLFFF